MKTVITDTGIKTHLIRMFEIFKKLDKNFNHILIYLRQHLDRLLSDIFFDGLDIMEPDYNLEVGGSCKEHFRQTSDLSVKFKVLLILKML